MKCFRVSQLLIFATVLLVAGVAAQAQSHEVKVFSVRLGDKVINIPAPRGFEEVTSQFESMKTRFTITEAPDNEVLAGYLPVSDCELLRRGEKPLLTYFSRVSVLRQAKELAISDSDFNGITAEFRKNAMAILDPDGPQMKSLTKRLEKGLSDVNSVETKIDFSKPQNLGTFDVRENVYGTMILMVMDAEIGGKQATVPLIVGTTILRVKDRVMFVYTYRKYDSKADLETLKDFSKQWNDSILAANIRHAELK